MRADGLPHTGCFAQWKGHRDDKVDEPKEALCGRPAVNVSQHDIARRAYELYLARDCKDGHDVNDWLQGERELRRGASMNRDELEGKAEALKGKIKQAAGAITRDRDLHDEGVIDEIAGKTHAAMGRTKRKIGEAIEHVGNVIKK